MTPGRGAGVPVADALDSARVAIGASGSASPRLDAELLVAHVLGVRRERLIIDRDLAVQGPAIHQLQDLVRRRSVDREPIAYLLGWQGFRHLDLAVDRRVLIPRPETEALVDVAFSLSEGARVLDVGTGSGAIALATASERPDLDVWATDISADAIAVARANGDRLGLTVTWRVGDLLDAVTGESFDAIISNPPYVADGDRAGLAPDVRDHEPAGALFAGVDGLDVYRRLAVQASGRAPLVAVEVGLGQAGAVEALLREAGLARIETIPDLAGIDRIVVGRTP